MKKRIFWFGDSAPTDIHMAWVIALGDGKYDLKIYNGGWKSILGEGEGGFVTQEELNEIINKTVSDLEGEIDKKQDTLTAGDGISIKDAVIASTTWKNGTGTNSVMTIGAADASGKNSVAEGSNTTASGSYTHAEGLDSKATYWGAHAEGCGTTASGQSSHSEGEGTVASAAEAHSEGWNTEASGNASHSEGHDSVASGQYSHAEGDGTIASGQTSHAEGTATVASAAHTHTEGFGTQATNAGEHAEGRWNKSTTSSNADEATISSIGIGSSDTDRKNAMEVKKNGDVYVNGVGDYDGTNYADAKTLQEVVNESAFASSASFSSVVYVKDDKKIIFTTNDGETAEIDATDFIKDGMVKDVAIVTKTTEEGKEVRYLEITFNSDAGDKVIDIALDDIFDPDDYYTKSEIDTNIKKYTDKWKTLTVTHVKSATGDTHSSSVFTQTADGVTMHYECKDMSKTDNTVTKHDDAIGNATNELYGVVKVDSALSGESENPVQNKVVNEAIQKLDDAIDSNTTAINGMSKNWLDGSADYSVRTAGSAEEGDDYTIGQNAMAVGSGSKASGGSSIAEGYQVTASGNNSHAEGMSTIASGIASHAEGDNTQATGNYSHAEGLNTTANGAQSHAAGNGTTTNNNNETAVGRFNISTAKGDGYASDNTLLTVGNGTKTASANAIELKYNNDLYINGVGDYNGTNYEEAKTLQEVIGGKQDTLTAGDNITIEEVDNVLTISANASAEVEAITNEEVDTTADEVFND